MKIATNDSISIINNIKIMLTKADKYFTDVPTSAGLS